MDSLSVNIVRGVFLVLCCVLGAIVALGFEIAMLPGILAGFSFATTLILVDFLLKSFTFREFSHGTIGLMIGLFCAWLILRVDFFENPWFDQFTRKEAIQHLVELALYSALGFFGMTQVDQVAVVGQDLIRREPRPGAILFEAFGAFRR